MVKLRKAYFDNVTTIDEILRQNIAYLSDVITRDAILQAVVFQASANSNGNDKSQPKNTFLIR